MNAVPIMVDVMKFVLTRLAHMNVLVKMALNLLLTTNLVKVTRELLLLQKYTRCINHLYC